ncbi:MAG TPA: hypothetical protein VLL54_20640 [Pyrinomonadaceae bacterium]|nr:hypothetical protein [Pyrinomonadaceae bacterium]
MNLSIAIQHTPDDSYRRTWVEAMLQKLRNEEPALPIHVVEDKERHGSWPTYRRTLMTANGASHHLILNDDVSLCKDFLAAARKAISARPKNIISLYTNSPYVFTARQRGESWIEKSLVAGPAIIWPTALIREFIDWERVHIRTDFPWEDARVSMWLYKTCRRAFATVPSLAQHLGYKASLIGLNASSKVATWYVGDQRSALEIDWSRGLTAWIRDPERVKPEWWKFYRPQPMLLPRRS